MLAFYDQLKDHSSRVLKRKKISGKNFRCHLRKFQKKIQKIQKSARGTYIPIRCYVYNIAFKKNRPRRVGTAIKGLESWKKTGSSKVSLNTQPSLKKKKDCKKNNAIIPIIT